MPSEYTPSRRTVLKYGAAAIGGGGATATLATGGSEPARADVEADELDVSDASVELGPDESVVDVTADATVGWSYTASRVPDKVACFLEAGPQPDPIASAVESGDLTKNTEGTTMLSGSVLSSAAYAVEDFALAGDGTATEQTVPLAAVVELEYGGEVVADATVSRDVTIAVNPEPLSGSVSASAEAEVSITIA